MSRCTSHAFTKCLYLLDFALKITHCLVLLTCICEFFAKLCALIHDCLFMIVVITAFVLNYCFRSFDEEADALSSLFHLFLLPSF